MVQKQKGELFAWVTVTYRTIALIIIAIALVFFTILYFLFPDTTRPIVDKFSKTITAEIDKVTGAEHPKAVATTAPQAHFTSFDGTVRVKKANSNTWVAADYSLPLEKGDIVQTQSEGIAKIAFADGSTYSIQPDALITIEENTTNAAQQVEAAVRINVGVIQLNTSDAAASQQVRIDNSTTTIGKDSALQASNDRKKGAPEVLVTKGVGTFEIAGEKQTLAPYEKVSFNPETNQVKKEKEVAPPVLLAPANMIPVFENGPGKQVDFAWTPVEGVDSYHIRISKNPYFSSIEKEARVSSPSWRVTGLPEGKYYWVVQSVARGKESIESDKNGFTLINRGNTDVSLPLDLEPFIQIGHVIEVKGKTEQSARVMVNGQQVPVVNEDGTFIFFTPPLPTGDNIVTVTAANEKGGVAFKTQHVVIQ